MPQSDPTHMQSWESFHVTLTFNRPLTDTEVEELKLKTQALEAVRVPLGVKAAYSRSHKLGFRGSSEPDVGRLLSVLAAAVPWGGRVLELGTGAGVGLAWIVHGLGQRSDVEVISIEIDPERAAVIREAEWPDWVSTIIGDAEKLVGTLGLFDLIFPDTPGGKIYKLRDTIAALSPGGVLLLDDMRLYPHDPPERRARLAFVRDQLFGDSQLFCAQLPFSSWVVLAVRQRS
jgi:demethylmenaquinone methyltransferase/2-methoxy-6-polyprenyl-1,4-benzoquinol methylase